MKICKFLRNPISATEYNGKIEQVVSAQPVTCFDSRRFIQIMGLHCRIMENCNTDFTSLEQL